MNQSLLGQVTPDIVGAIHNVFIICIVVLAVALVASIIMKEFPLVENTN